MLAGDCGFRLFDEASEILLSSDMPSESLDQTKLDTGYRIGLGGFLILLNLEPS